MNDVKNEFLSISETLSAYNGISPTGVPIYYGIYYLIWEFVKLSK